jgi:uncharacterized protein YdeI (YjbR/CyaY-like superfamily)
MKDEGRMGRRDPRVDAYIEKSAPFAQPILTHLRAVVHEACPEVTEDLKWRMPHFMHHGILCGMGAFKEHCIFGFWKAPLVLGGEHENPMSQFGHLTSLSELPPKKALAAYVKKAARLNEEGVKLPRPAKGAAKKLVVPKDFVAALARSAAARRAFENFAPSHKREYVEWIEGAKREETRKRRLASAIDQIAAGKPQNWKYMK